MSSAFDLRPAMAAHGGAGNGVAASGNGKGARVETLFCFLALSTFLGAYATLPLRLAGSDIQGGESNPYTVASMLLVLVGTLGPIAANWRAVFAVARLGGAVNVFVALALASTLWSYDPAITLRRSLILLQIVLFAYYLVARFPVERSLRLLAAVYAVALSLSVLLAVAVPSVGVMQVAELAGAWCGVFEHKSALGEACVLGSLCFAWQWAHVPEQRGRYLAGVLLSLALAVMSHSKTAQLTILLFVPLAFYLRILRSPGLGKVWALYVSLAVLLALAAVVFFYFPELTAAVGKDETLTGRIPVWKSLLGLAFQRPLSGYGYMGFFLAGNPDMEYVWGRGGWTMWEAHNTTIGILLELGLPGLAVSAWVLLATVKHALSASSSDAAPWVGFAAIYIISYAATSFVEMIMFRPDIHSVLVPMFYVALRRQALRRRLAEVGAAAGPAYGAALRLQR